MQKLDTNEIDNILNEFLSEYELECFCGSDFTYYPASNKIEYSLVYPARMDKLFLDYAKSLGLKYHVNVFMLSLLHEIGHHETIDDIDDEVYNYCHDVKATLTTSEEDTLTYFSLEDEHAATAWAVDYINSNYETIVELWGRLKFAINNFYKKHNIY